MTLELYQLSAAFFSLTLGVRGAGSVPGFKKKMILTHMLAGEADRRAHTFRKGFTRFFSM